MKLPHAGLLCLLVLFVLPLRAGAQVNTAASVSPVPNDQKSLALNGATTYVEVPDGPGVNLTGAFTAEAWVKLNSPTGSYQSVFERYGEAVAGGDNGGFYLRVRPDGRLEFAVLRSIQSGWGVTGNTLLTGGVWHHVAGVCDGNQLRVYLDGSLDATLNVVTHPAAGTTNLFIGGGNWGGGRVNGLIDEARVSAAPLYTADFTPDAWLKADAATRGLWKFDNDSPLDYSSYGNNCTFVGGPAFSADVPTPARHSVSLNGTDAQIRVPHSTSIDIAGPITVEAWFKLDGTAGQQQLVSRQSATGAYFLVANDGMAQFYVSDGAGQSDFAIAYPANITPHAWHHMAGVFDGAQLRVYLDGALCASKTTTVGPGQGTADLTIGGFADGVSAMLDGLVDEVRISAGALYASNFAPPLRPMAGAGTRGLWKFDGGTLQDASGYSNHGTPAGGINYSADTPAGGQEPPAAPPPAPQGETVVVINFDDLAHGTPVTNQYPVAVFSAGLNRVPAVWNYLVAGASYQNVVSRPCALSRKDSFYGTWDHFTPLTVDFTKPVNNLRFNTSGIDAGNGTIIARVDVYQNNVFTRTVNIPGYGWNTYTYVNFGPADAWPNGVSNITRIVITQTRDSFGNYVDPYGLSYDDFTFTYSTTPPATPTPTPAATPTPTPEVKSVSFEAVNGNLLDDQPSYPAFGCGPQCGKRIFPDKQSPADGVNRRTVRVKAETSYPANTTIYFRAFDLDDPSSDDAELDANGPAGNDNKGPNPLGALSAPSALTDAAGVASVIFTTTKQPGDNFMVAAGADSAYLNGLTEQGIGLRDAAGGALPTRKGKATPMLTVWRNVHVEVDSMGPAVNNGVVAHVVESLVVTAPRSCGEDVCIITSVEVCVDQSLEEGRFENGSLVVGTSFAPGAERYGIVSNTTDCLSIDQHVTLPAGATVTLVDDDDFNSNDGSNPDGDDGEDVTPPSLAMLQHSDDPALNVFAPAYVRPVYDVGDNNPAVPFKANVEAATQEAKEACFDFDARGTEADENFWTVYLLGSYQYTIEKDDDPDAVDTTDPVAGSVDRINGLGAMIFMETITDCLRIVSDFQPATVAAHEVGHLFNGTHGDGALMATVPHEKVFNAKTLNKIRSIDHP